MAQKLPKSTKVMVTYSEVGRTSMYCIICGVQGFILGLLLFLIHVNDLNKASSILKPVMFVDHTNLFLSNKDISNLELQNISIWQISYL